MSSLLTNTSAMTALMYLTQTQSNLNKVQNEISTGKAISSAADNASYWSIATKMQSDAGALGAVDAALSESKSMVATMSAAMNSTISVMDAIKNDLVTASNPGADLSKIQTDITAQQNMLVSIGQSSTFNGQNFLQTTGGNVNLIATYDPTNGVSFLTVNTTNTALFGTQGAASTTGILGQSGANYTTASILTLNITAATAGDLANMLKDVDGAIGALTNAASILGATTTNLTVQQNYESNLSDSLTTGVGSLIDANMNEAATKLAALQVQQQLGVQALGIANSNTQLILKLFGG
jgi:flagellin